MQLLRTFKKEYNLIGKEFIYTVFINEPILITDSVCEPKDKTIFINLFRLHWHFVKAATCAGCLKTSNVSSVYFV